MLGTDRRCAAETVAALAEDLRSGRLRPPQRDAEWFESLVRTQCTDAIDYRGWRTIDAVEREAGRRTGRPRVKLARREEVLAVVEQSLAH